MQEAKLVDFAQTQLMFNTGEVGGGYFSGPGTATYCIKPFEDGWTITHRDTNEMRASPFVTFGKDKWTTEEIKEFFNAKDFSNLKQSKAFKSEHESIDIKTKEDFLSLFD